MSITYNKPAIPIGGPYLYINEEKAKHILESIQRYCRT